MTTRSIALLSATLLLTGLGGCTSVSRSYPGQSADQVWTAMTIVAREPRDENWKVIENNVYADEAARQIEINRILHRYLYRADAKPIYERWEWKFQVTMISNDPPTLKFVSRGWAVPMHATHQANEFLDEVGDVLNGGQTAKPADQTAAPTP